MSGFAPDLASAADLHAGPAQDVGGGRQNRIAEALCHRVRFVAAAGEAVGRLLEAELVDQLGETLAVFGQIDAVG